MTTKNQKTTKAQIDDSPMLVGDAREEASRMPLVLKLRAKGDSSDLPVLDMAEAATMYRTWIEGNDYGGSDLAQGSGDVLQDGKRVGYVSYNGRIWKADKKTPYNDDAAASLEVLRMSLKVA